MAGSRVGSGQVMHKPVFIDCIRFNLTLLEVIELRHHRRDRTPHINTLIKVSRKSNLTRFTLLLDISTVCINTND